MTKEWEGCINMMTLKELAKKHLEYRKMQEDLSKKWNIDTACKEVANALKTFDFEYYLHGAPWSVGKICENTIEVKEEVWLKIEKQAFAKLDFDYTWKSVKDYTTCDLLNNLKKRGVIYDYNGSAQEENLVVTLFIDGPHYNPNPSKPATKKKVVVSKKKPIATNK